MAALLSGLLLSALTGLLLLLAWLLRAAALLLAWLALVALLLLAGFLLVRIVHNRSYLYLPRDLKGYDVAQFSSNHFVGGLRGRKRSL